MIRVLLVDDQKLVRAGFRSILDDEDDIHVVGEAAEGQEALRLARELNPDLVLMDIQMPGVDGLEATRRLSADPALAHIKVIMLTTFDLDDYVYAALRAGAGGFLLKDAEPEEMLNGVRVVVRGDALLAPSVTRRLIADVARRSRAPAPDPRLNALTAREREVMLKAAEGLSNEEIAGRLFLSPGTVKTHVSRIMTKLGVRDRVQLVVLAYESAMVIPGWQD
ncbi:response regulator [Sphaerisporangium corydalis]|uniref:Response regulator n=1 Tax=Sphaerisporangium corydalis TaxID=1441875 RepID=A0ABV9E6L4_9ACTN|nr:response regulator transcription factor [Sphaerisporangium corydalis]